MYRALNGGIVGVLAVCVVAAAPAPTNSTGTAAQAASAQSIDLAALQASGKLRAVNRDVAKGQDPRGGVRVSEKEGPGVVWIDGTEFATGTIEVEVKGRDMLGRSFLGVAFHRKDDATYEAVYVRPFNFRAQEPDRHQHAVQYMQAPDNDWPRLRKDFPEEFENPVDASVSPTDWVPLKVVVKGNAIQIFVGAAKTPALEARKLGSLAGGQVGLWVGNNSDGEFANLRLTAAK
jgi:hypothetical protein